MFVFLCLLAIVVISTYIESAVAADCTLKCDVDQTCYASSADAMNCLSSIPFNETWATTTIDVLYQSLENFGFGALYHNTGPPYVYNLDILGELQATQALIDSAEFATDLDFQEHVQNIFQRTMDAHTRYQKPACYNAVFLQPFAFDVRVVEVTQPSGSVANEPTAFLMRNLYTDQYAKMFPALPLDDLVGQQVLLLNGVEFTTELSSWGDSHETRSNNRGIRFNAVVRSYMYRSAISYSVLPMEDLVITLVNGTSYTLPWMASYTTGLANITVCEALPKPTVNGTEASVVGASRDQVKVPSLPSLLNPKHHPQLTDPPEPLVHSTLHASRPDREEIIPSDNATYFVSCFVQTILTEDGEVAGVERVLVMKVSSFAPPGEYQEAWSGFLGDVETCLSVTFDVLVVDVMQNGGGYVCLGLRLLELLVEDYNNDHTLVQMNYDLPHSPLMDEYIRVVNAPDPVPDESGGIIDKSTGQPFPNGDAYYYPGRNVTQGGVVSWRTNFFSLDCSQAEAMPADGFRPATFMPPQKLILLTDGTCGSTCACFTKIPQEAGKATLVGAGGIWDEGMDVSSFAGGFISNPDEMWGIANASNLSFPLFVTNQRWQFGWAVWYSEKLPSRPAQFTVQEPNYREAFWGFPHSSINASVTTEMVSALYDSVIASTVARLAVEATAAAQPDSESCSGQLSETTGNSLIGLCSVLGATVAALLVYVYCLHSSQRGYNSVSKGDGGSSLHDPILNEA